MMKHKWRLVIFISSLVLILSGYILSIVLLLQKEVNHEQEIIGAIGEGISFFGTMVLGIVAFWQTRTANEISRAELRRDMVTNLVLQSNVNIRPVIIAPRMILEYSKDLQPEGIYCSTKCLDKFEKTQEEKFFGFMFQMASIGAPLDKVIVNDVKINKSLKGKDGEKDYYVDLQLLNIQDEVVFSYNPKKQCYIVGLYINMDESIYDKLVTKGMLVIDIDVNVISNYGTVLQHKFSINFEKKDAVIAKLRNGKNSSQDTDLENVLIYKGEPQYAKR